MRLQDSIRPATPVPGAAVKSQRGKLIVQAIMIDDRPTRLVEEGSMDSIKLKFPDPDREVEIVVWTLEGRKALAFIG